MDVIHVSTVHQPLPDAIRSVGAKWVGAEADLVERPMPIATALRWIPVGQSSAVDPIHPIFITRSALEAVQERATPPGDVEASFGFLVGEVYVAPETRMPYVVIEAALHGGWAITGDDLESAMVEARSIAEEAVRRDRGRLVGWYQTHSGPDSRLSVAGVGAHRACFDQPWAVALVVAGRHGLTGGVFRATANPTRPNQYLPFYELLEGDSLLPGGPKVTGLVWQNYCAPGLAIAAADDVRPMPKPPRRVLLDDTLDEAALATESLRRMRPRRRLPFTLWWVRAGALGFATVAVLFGAYRALGSSIPLALGGPTSAGAPLADVVDRLSDSVSMAVRAYDVRAHLYAGKKMTCADLARGLVDLEQRWATYVTTRVRGGATPAAAVVVGGHRLQDDVDLVEREFAATACPRP